MYRACGNASAYASRYSTEISRQRILNSWRQITWNYHGHTGCETANSKPVHNVTSQMVLTSNITLTEHGPPFQLMFEISFVMPQAYAEFLSVPLVLRYNHLLIFDPYSLSYPSDAVENLKLAVS